MVTGQPTPSLRLLMDTNVFIALEPWSSEAELGLEPAAKLMQLVHSQRHELFVHPAIADDIRQDTVAHRRAARLTAMRKFSSLDEGPVSEELINVAGASANGSNDHRDLRLLASVWNRAASYLVTEDNRLHRRARRAGLSESLLTVAEAIELLSRFVPTFSSTPPLVQRLQAHALDEGQGIFESLTRDYAEFRYWLRNVVKPDWQNRTCFVVVEDGLYAALAIIKDRDDSAIEGLPWPSQKLSTFKVSEHFSGSKLGELLLKSVFLHARATDAACLFVEVLPRHEILVNLFQTFGFKALEEQTNRGEFVLVKRLIPDEASNLAPLEHHIRFGPPALKTGANVYIVPIQPVWYSQLFPDSPQAAEASDSVQLTFDMPEADRSLHPLPWGNALRKAYVSTSRIRKIVPGDTLVFYLSGSNSVTAVGVVEDTFRSSDPLALVSFMGKRTVYSVGQLAEKANRETGAIAILFRQDRFITPPISADELRAVGHLNGWPQSITQMGSEGARWMHQQIVEE